MIFFTNPLLIIYTPLEMPAAPLPAFLLSSAFDAAKFYHIAIAL